MKLQIRVIGIFYNKNKLFPAGCWIAIHRRRNGKKKDSIRMYSPTSSSWRRLRNVINRCGKMYLTSSTVEWKPGPVQTPCLPSLSQ